MGLLFGYAIVQALVIGSLLASHTLLALPVISRLGEMRLEPMVITVEATVISDTLSLVVFAICVPTYKAGFSMTSFAFQILEIATFVPFILFGVSIGAWLLKKVEDDENAYFIVMMAILAVAGLIAALSICRGSLVHSWPDWLSMAPSKKTGEREAGILWQFSFYSNFLCSNRIPNRSQCLHHHNH